MTFLSPIKHFWLFLQKELQVEKFRNSFFTYRILCMLIFVAIQFHMMINRQGGILTDKDAKKDRGYLSNGNYTIYASSNHLNDPILKGIPTQLNESNSMLGNIFGFENSSIAIKMKSFKSVESMTSKLDDCVKNFVDDCRGLLFGVDISHLDTDDDVDKKRYTIYLFDNSFKNNILFIGNIKYAILQSLLDIDDNKDVLNPEIPYIFLYDVNKANKVLITTEESNAEYFFLINYCYQLFTLLPIIACVHSIIKQRNGLLKKYFHNIGVSRFIYFGSCIIGPLLEFMLFYTISGYILLHWTIPHTGISLPLFVCWKFLYTLAALGFGVILTSLCDGKQDILVAIIFWIFFVHLDIGFILGMTSYDISAAINVNVIDKNIARMLTSNLWNKKTSTFPLKLKYEENFFDTDLAQVILLFVNIILFYGLGILIDVLWPNDSYNQFSFLYYVRLFRNSAIIRHLIDKDDYGDLNQAIQKNESKKSSIKDKSKKGLKKRDRGKAIVGSHISKIYKSTGETALEDVSFVFESNEINVVVGFNESGLASLMEIVAGACKVSRGRIYYFNKDINGFGRHKIGYCPHFIVTYTGMTVGMAIKFFTIIKKNQFSRLSGYKKDHLFINSDVDVLVEALGLNDFMDISCENLPEKVLVYVNLCVAFVGNPKIVVLNGILDKLPPEDLVKIIGILKDMKDDKTLIISTQDMEIVDQLADHVLLLKRGKVIDEGSLQTLKDIHCSYFKLDLRLKRSIISEGELTPTYDTIHDFVKRFIPEALIEETQSYGNHLVLRLPQDMKYVFGKLLDSLEKKANELHVIDFSIDSYNMEDSFLLSNVGATLEPALQKSIDLINRLPGFDDRSSGISLYTVQFFTLIKKRLSYVFVDFKTTFFMMIMTILLAAALSQFSKFYAVTECRVENKTSFRKLDIQYYAEKVNPDTSIYKIPEKIKSVYESNDRRIGDFKFNIREMPKKHMFWSETYPLRISPLEDGYQAIITSTLCTNASFKVMDTFMNLLWKQDNYDYITSNVVIVNRNGNNNDAELYETNVISILKFVAKKTEIDWDIFIPSIQIMLVCIITYFIIAFPLFVERIKGFKQQQYYAGVSPFLYWITNFVADCFLGTIIIGIFVTLIGILDKDIQFIDTFIPTFVYFKLNLPIFYILTFFGKSFMHILSMVIIFIILLQTVLCIFDKVDDLKKIDFQTMNLAYIWKAFKTYMIPFNYLYKVKMSSIFGNEKMKEFASYFDDSMMTGIFISIYAILMFVLLITMECGVLIQIRNYISAFRYILSENKRRKITRRKRISNSRSTTDTETTDTFSEEGDIFDDEKHVSTIIEDDDPVIVIENAKPNLSDVNLHMKLDFDVFPGECYCMYIKDDKDRESVFNFITGNLKRKKGYITIDDKDIGKKGMPMGYSPLKNVVLPFFTPFEHYKFFASLSGFKKSKLQAINMLNLTGLIQYRHKHVRYCDLNQKRRLVVGISALTQSGALFLDSPTDFLYKQGRIEIWELINILLVEKEEAIVITTNNLEECNELASRFGIIDSGYVEYNGTYTRLKKMYCDGFNFKITVSNPSLEVLICLDQIMVSEYDAIPADLTKISAIMEWDVPKMSRDGKNITWEEMYSFGEKLFLRYGKKLSTSKPPNDTADVVNENVDNDSKHSKTNAGNDDMFEDDDDDDDFDGDVGGYGGLKSHVTVPHIIDYVITNNSLDQIVFKIQNQ